MNKITVTTLKEKKTNREPITVLTVYDYTFAKILDQAGVEVLLVGDSLGMVMLGHPNTLPVTLENMIVHTQAVARGAQHALIITDMPFMTYQINEEEAVRNAGRLVQEGKAEGVKIEGGQVIAGAVRRIVSAGIPVMGHIGLTPQSIHTIGGYKIQGKSKDATDRLLADAKALEEAGCFSLVLECVPAAFGEEVSKALSIPVIGIGAGPKCDGQVLVMHDLLGLYPNLRPKFVKRFADLGELAEKAVRNYVEEVKSGKFPSQEQSF